MTGNVREIIESHQCYCEVSPYFMVCEERPAGHPVTVKRIHAGFDVDIYGVKRNFEPDPAAGYWLVYSKLKEVVDTLRHEHNHGCSIEVIPFGSKIVLDTKAHLQPMDMLRIRITHTRGVSEPAGAAEQEASRAVEAQLSQLGITAGRREA